MVKIILFLLIVFIAFPRSVSAHDTGFTHEEPTSTSAAKLKLKKEFMQSVRPTIKQEIKMAKQNFRDQIKQMKDLRKQTVVTKINNGITNANQNRTQMMSNALSRFSNIISDLSTKSASLKLQGKDTASLDAAILSAQSSISAAQTAVNTQKANTYSSELSDETNLKAPISQMVLQFKNDILATFQSVQTAKRAVVAAMQEMAKLKSETSVNITTQQ